MGAGGTDREAGVEDVGGPWHLGRPGTGSKTQGALRERTFEEVRGSQDQQVEIVGLEGHCLSVSMTSKAQKVH